MDAIDFAALALAVSAVTDSWFLGSLFAEARAFFEEKAVSADTATEQDGTGDPDTPTVDERPYWMRIADRAIPDAAAELMNCPFCLSHHIPYVLLLLFYVPSLFLGWPYAAIVKLPIYSLACTQAARWLSVSRRRYEHSNNEDT